MALTVWHNHDDEEPQCATNSPAANEPTAIDAPAILESVKIDLMGEIHFDFDEAQFVPVSQGYARLRLPTRLDGRSVAWNRPISYQDVTWIGVIYRRQWEMLVLAVVFVPLGTLLSIISVGGWGPMAFGLVVLLLLGLFPLGLFLHGRAFLGIASDADIVVLPLDQNRNVLRRILGLLRQYVQQSVQWQLEVTAFSDVATWDNRPPSGRAFNQKRYGLISVLLALWGASNLLAKVPHCRLPAGILAAGVLLVAVAWVFRSAIRKTRGK